VASLRSRLASVDAMPVALVAALAAVLAFAAAFLIGLAAAPTREHVNRAVREPAPARPQPLTLLGSATALPAAPPARRAVHVRVPRHRAAPAPRRVPPSPVPKLLSGTG
jgi:hypothetical protein